MKNRNYFDLLLQNSIIGDIEWQFADTILEFLQKINPRFVIACVFV